MIYLDNAATTPVRSEVLEAMLPCFAEDFGNASSAYTLGNRSRNAIRRAREAAAAVLGARPEEIFFTSGGTESDNWALRAAADAYAAKAGRRGGHILTTRIEHPAVLRTCEELEREGVCVTYLDVDAQGRLSPESVRGAVRSDTFLVSVMTANNEIGTLQPLAKIGEITRERGIWLHTDAVQAYGQIPLCAAPAGGERPDGEMEALNLANVDLLSASAHKIGGPKGTGLLYIRRGVPVRPLIRGGAQERGRRAGTENVPGIVGMGEAARLALEELPAAAKRQIALRDRLIGRVLQEIPNTLLNGAYTPAGAAERLPGNVSFCFPGIEGETLLVLLDQRGICASSGSACSTGALEPSHVLTAIGRTALEMKGSLRLTLSARNTMEEIDTVADILKEEVARLRGMTPLYEEYRKAAVQIRLGE